VHEFIRVTPKYLNSLTQEIVTSVDDDIFLRNCATKVLFKTQFNSNNGVTHDL